MILISTVTISIGFWHVYKILTVLLKLRHLSYKPNLLQMSSTQDSLRNEHVSQLVDGVNKVYNNKASHIDLRAWQVLQDRRWRVKNWLEIAVATRELNWSWRLPESKNTWRAGDGQTAKNAWRAQRSLEAKILKGHDNCRRAGQLPERKNVWWSWFSHDKVMSVVGVIG